MDFHNMNLIPIRVLIGTLRSWINIITYAIFNIQPTLNNPSKKSTKVASYHRINFFYIFLAVISFLFSQTTVAQTLDAPLENIQSIIDSGGTVSGVTFEAGFNGNGVRMDGAGDQLSFPTANVLDPMQGTISFKFKPDWDGDTDNQTRYFLQAGPFKILKFYSAVTKRAYFVFNFDDGIDGGNGTFREVNSTVIEPFVIDTWKAGEWHTIELFWDLTGINQNIGFRIDGNSKLSLTTKHTWDQVLGLPSTFTLGSTTGFIKHAGGVIDELKIYEHSLWDFADPIGAKMSNSSGNGVWDIHETIYNSPTDAPVLAEDIASGQDYIFYEKPAFERVYEGSVPVSSEIKDNITYRVAQDDYETLFFNLYSRKNQNNITLSFSDFSNGANVLDDAKIKVLKNWWQAGVSSKKSLTPHYIPELFLSNDISGDAALLSDQEAIEAMNWSFNDLPSFPELPEVHTNLLAQTSKQFAIIIKAPTGATPGIYTSTVLLKDAGGITLKELTLSLEVLPFNLDESGKNHSVYYPALLNTVSPAHPNSVSLDRYKKQVEDIAKHGMNGLVVYGSDPSALSQKIAIIKQNNINGQIVFFYDESTSETSKDLLETNGYIPWFYGIDEPNGDTKIQEHIKISKKIHELGNIFGKSGGKVITAITKGLSLQLDDQNDPIYSLPNVLSGTYEPLDYENLNLGASQTYIKNLISGAQTPDKPASYYWQALEELPAVNRSRAGYYLWNTGLDGTLPFVYQVPKGNPYNDFDIWSTITPSYRDHLITYPSEEGPVTTMQWEAFREGIDDIRYLQTWKRYKDSAKTQDVSAATASEVIVQGVLNHYKDLRKLNNITPFEFARDRNVIQNEIIKMMNISSVSQGEI